MCIVHNLYCGYSLSAYVIISIIMIDQNKTFRSEKSARALPGQARVCRRLWIGLESPWKILLSIFLLYERNGMTW